MADRLDSGRPAARTAVGAQAARAARITPMVGLPGQTAGESVASALRLKNRARRQPAAAQGHEERLGRSTGVAMKAGQMLWLAAVGTTMPGTYRRTYLRELAGLCDDTPPVPPGLVAEAIETELSRAAGQVFAEFCPVPLAVTAISQVHSAVLHNGRRVAVKVQCPRAGKAMRACLARTELLAVIGPLIEAVVPAMTGGDIEDVARDLSGRVEEQIDLRARAANQREFADAYRGHPFIRIPDVVPELSTRRVLTTDLSDGLGWAAALQGPDALRNAWGEVIYRFTGGSLRRLRLRQSGFHPGNYLFHTGGSVTFLGFGAVERFQPEQVTAQAAGIDTEMACLLEDLDATAPWNAIREEWDRGHPPATSLGELDRAWRTARTKNN